MVNNIETNYHVLQEENKNKKTYVNDLVNKQLIS